MVTLPAKFEPVAVNVAFTDGRLLVCLADGRELSVPLDFFPRLKRASARSRRHWELIGGGIGIHWPDLDEDISVENLLAPRTSHWRGRKSTKGASGKR
jgi:hypothetical protein